ncbi:MAG: hypothetical protein PVF87_06930 [Acidimicrobiia bacterium]|jgi:hypothetical protein
MSDYHGDAEFLDESGEFLGEAVVYLHKDEPAGESITWGGRVDPTAVTSALTAAKKIRLADGSEGAIAISGMSVASGGPFSASETATIIGSGKPPF